MKEFIWYHDSYLLASWDHTAQTSAMLHNLLMVVNNALGGKKIQPKSLFQCHPYRNESEEKTNKVNSSNIHVFRLIGNNLVRRQ